jgi:DNA-binding XRE family transcriptional regulator
MYTAWRAQVEVGSLSEQAPIAWRYCGHQFKMWRQEAGVSREDVGKESNYSPDTITAFERGARTATTASRSPSAPAPSTSGTRSSTRSVTDPS